MYRSWRNITHKIFYYNIQTWTWEMKSSLESRQTTNKLHWEYSAANQNFLSAWIESHVGMYICGKSVPPDGVIEAYNRDVKRKMGLTRYCTIHLNNCDLYLSQALSFRKPADAFVISYKMLHNTQSPLNRIPLEHIKGIDDKLPYSERDEFKIKEIKCRISEELWRDSRRRRACPARFVPDNTRRIATSLIFHSNNNDRSFALSNIQYWIDE